jgi:hypothetical protein
MQAGKIDVWNKIKMRSAAMDVEAAHEARKAKEAEAKRKRELQEALEWTFGILFIVVFFIGVGWGLLEFIDYCKAIGCGR